MTTLDLYRKHKAGDISREKFLYEVRRDNNLPFITNLTSYDDAVKILKNKGIVTEVDTKEAKKDEAVKAEVKAKASTTKKVKELHIDHANPYEYRHGIAYELDCLDDYSAESLEKAKEKVLKNLAKDANFYSNLLNQKQSHYEFKAPETDKPGYQARPDGGLKKELKKNEKANVKDNLGKKEAGKLKPKGIKIMPDKGVEGKEKTIKEGIEDKVEDAIKSGKIKPEEVKAAAEKAMKGDSSELATLMFGKLATLAGFKLEEDNVEEGIVNEEISQDDFFDSVIDVLVKDKILTKNDLNRLNSGDNDELMDALFDEWKSYAGYDETDQSISTSDINLSAKAIAKKLGRLEEDKHAKLKEALKKALKQELLDPKDIQAAKSTGDVVNIPVQDTAAQTAAKNAKINYSTYK